MRLRIRQTTAVSTLAFALALALGAAQNSNSQAADREVAAGVEAMRAGRLAEARINLEKSVQEQPENAEAQLQLGLLLGQSGDVQAASDAFRKAIRARPDWPDAHYNLGLTMIADSSGKRDWPGAIAEFREALRLRPGYVEAHRLLGVSLAQSGQRDASLVELRAALVGDPNSAETHLELGKALESKGDSAAAEREYRAAIKLHPGYSEGEIALGKLLLKHEGEDLEAIEHFHQALRTNPDIPAAQYSLAKAYQQNGRTAEAAIAFRQAAALTKRQEDAVQCTRLSNEGLDAARRGQGETAIRNLREAVELRPDSAIAHYNLGLVLADRGDLAAGRTQITEAISLLPTDPRFYMALGRMWKRSGDRERWLAAIGKAGELDPGNEAVRVELRDVDKSTQHTGEDDPFLYGAASDTPDAHFAFATVLARRNDWTGAITEWLRVLAERPDDVEARNNLGVSYAHAGNDENAELEFRKALQVSPASAGAHFGLAVLDLQRGNKADAIGELQQVLRVQPDYPQARNLLATAGK